MSIEDERAARELAEQRAATAERASALSDAISAKGPTGERAQLARRLVDQTAEDLPAAVDAVIAGLPRMFATEPSPPAPRAVRRPGPSTPPALGLARTMLPSGYVDPQTFMETPAHIRHTAEFRRRVEVSRPYWPAMRIADLPKVAD